MAACRRFAFLLLLAVPALACAADLGAWDPSTLYRDGISARELIGAPGIGRHVVVPWDQLKFAEHLAFVQVSQSDLERGAYSLPTERTGTPPPAAQREWRANELLGDYASLEDAPRYGLVSDLIFDQTGRARGLVVERAGGEVFAYPYVGVRPGAGAYPLPYRAADALRLPHFDYAKLGAQSRYAGRLGSNASAGATTEERAAPGR